MSIDLEGACGSQWAVDDDLSDSPIGVSYNLSRLALSDVVRCGYAIRQMASRAESMEEVADSVVRHLFDSCLNQESGDREIALVRFFKTHAYGRLDDVLRRQARALSATEQISDRTKCLVLLGTAGEQSEWNSRSCSQGHQAIHLIHEQAVARIPMISQLVRQFGLELSAVTNPAPELLVELDQRNYNVFHVEHAPGSPFIPAQSEFVTPHGVRSVVGFGGMLPTGNLFVVIVFAKCHISRVTAEAFRTIALKVKASILPFEDHAVFSDRPATLNDPPRDDLAHEMAVLRSRAAALEASTV
ncbi:MAG: hypothetical protein HY000_19130 [Planctomycetes bacterium]|nr:hypothetical protein [Planctomycetota bacterium]